MIRIGSSASFQPVSIQATEQSETLSTASSQAQPQAIENAQTTAASSLHSWQRAELQQDGEMLHVELQNELRKQIAIEDSYEQMKEEVNKSKEAAEDKGSGALFGSIFGGVLVGTMIGEAIKPSETNYQDSEANPLDIVLEDVAGKYFSDTDPEE